jgi:hypothetical protein
VLDRWLDRSHIQALYTLVRYVFLTARGRLFHVPRTNVSDLVCFGLFLHSCFDFLLCY